jgi:hypothetical protein
MLEVPPSGHAFLEVRYSTIARKVRKVDIKHTGSCIVTDSNRPIAGAGGHEITAVKQPLAHHSGKFILRRRALYRGSLRTEDDE